MFFNWIKSIFKNPKSILTELVNGLDLAVPYMAKEIDELKGKPFNQMTSLEQAQKAVDIFQDYIRQKFGLNA